MGNVTNTSSSLAERKCEDCGRDVGQDMLFRWGVTPLCFDCKKPRVLATKHENEEWLVGGFAVYHTSILRALFRGGTNTKTPYAMLFTNKRLALFDPASKTNRHIVQEQIDRNKDLLDEVAQLQEKQRMKDCVAMLGIPFHGLLAYHLFRPSRDFFLAQDLSLASILVSLGSGRQLSGDEVSVLSSLDATYDITRQRPPLTFYQPGLQRILAPGWCKMRDECGRRYLIGATARDFCLFYFDNLCANH